MLLVKAMNVNILTSFECNLRFDINSKGSLTEAKKCGKVTKKH